MCLGEACPLVASPLDDSTVALHFVGDLNAGICWIFLWDVQFFLKKKKKSVPDLVFADKCHAGLSKVFFFFFFVKNPSVAPILFFFLILFYF